MAIDVQTKSYICPGEKHPISRSVHLARLAAAFEACRECPLREDGSRVAPEGVAAPKEQPKIRTRELIVRGGLRGPFLNVMNRSLAAALTTRFAQSLWERSQVGGSNDGIDRGARVARPTVVVGYDERPSSPTIFSAAVGAVRRMGCHVLDVGLVTKPCFWFALNHVHASGGLFVTGSGTEPAWTGIDFLWETARPASVDELAAIRADADELGSNGHLIARPTRTAGTQRAFQATEPYESSLAKDFAGANVGKIVCASASPLIGQLVQRLFKPLTCELVSIDLPIKIRNPARRRDEGILQLSKTVRDQQAQLGFLIDDDGQRCGFVDERGRHVSSAAIARLVVPLLLAEQPGSTVVLEPSAMLELRPLVEAMGGRCQSCSDEFAAIAGAVRDFRAVYGGGDSGRHWFLEDYPNCDALLVLAHVLTALGRASQPSSQLAAS
jgi:phosphomannomutase